VDTNISKIALNTATEINPV